MIEYNKILPNWLVRFIFHKIDFIEKGDYERKQFISYDTYRKDYYDMMDEGYKIHSLSNYFGVITVWYFKAK